MSDSWDVSIHLRLHPWYSEGWYEEPVLVWFWWSRIWWFGRPPFWKGWSKPTESFFSGANLLLVSRSVAFWDSNDWTTKAWSSRQSRPFAGLGRHNFPWKGMLAGNSPQRTWCSICVFYRVFWRGTWWCFMNHLLIFKRAMKKPWLLRGVYYTGHYTDIWGL